MGDIDATLYRADALSSVGRHDSAIALLQEALAEDPQSAPLLSRLTIVVARSGDLAEAESIGRRALGIDPRLVGVQLELLWIALRQGRFSEASEQADQVLAEHPEQSTALLYRSAAHAYARPLTPDSRAIAASALHLALERASDAQSLALASEIERQLGNPTAAGAHLAAALEQDPTNAGLLRLKAENSASMAERVSLLSGLLAADPFDARARSALSAAVRRSRWSRIRLQWSTMFALTAVAALTSGWWAFAGIALVLGGAFLAWGVALNGIRALPEVYAAARERRSLLGSNLAALWLLASVVAAAAIAGGAGSVALFPLCVALAAWLLGLLLSNRADLRIAAADDELAGAPTEIAAITAERWRGGLLSAIGCTSLALIVLPLAAVASSAASVVAAVGGLSTLLLGLVLSLRARARYGSRGGFAKAGLFAAVLSVALLGTLALALAVMPRPESAGSPDPVSTPEGTFDFDYPATPTPIRIPTFTPIEIPDFSTIAP